MFSLIYYLVVKRLMKTKNSVVEIQNAVMNHESRPLKWNPILTHIIRMKIQDPFSSSILRRHLEDTCAKVSFLINKKKRPWYKCFPVNFVKFSRTPFLQNKSVRLLFDSLCNSMNTLISFTTFKWPS